jgi:hypothetical protein
VSVPKLPTNSESVIPIDVPPPPPQMDAVLAAFETAPTRPLQSDIDHADRVPPEPLATGPVVPEFFLARLRTGLTIPPPRNWSPALWAAAVVGGVALAAAIVYPIVAHRSAAPPESSVATNASPPLEPSVPGTAAPTNSGAVDNGAPTAAPATSGTRTPPTQPETKTVRSTSPVHSGGAASGTTRKPCGKASKPCR